MSTAMTDDEAPSADAALTSKVNALDAATAALVAVIEKWPDHMHYTVMREVVHDLASELCIEDPWDEDDIDWQQVLRDIRGAINRGDIERALLLIHYQTGDY